MKGSVRINVPQRRVHVPNVTVKKTISIKYSECVSIASGIEHGKRTRPIKFQFMACLVLLAFFHIILKMARFSKVKSLLIKCMFWFSSKVSPEIFVIPRRIQRSMNTNVKRSASRVKNFSQILRKLEFCGQIFEK